MRLLFDANLSPKLVAASVDLYPGSAHVDGLDNIASDDARIWDFASRGGFVITTKDTDFLDLSLLCGPPPSLDQASRTPHQADRRNLTFACIMALGMWFFATKWRTDFLTVEHMT